MRVRDAVFHLLLSVQCSLYVVLGSMVINKPLNDGVDVQEEYTKEIIDWKCNSNLDCNVINSICINSTCQCTAGYIYNGNMTSCIRVAGYGENCEESIQCSRYLYSGGTCVKNICECAEGYYYMHGRCNAYTGLHKGCYKDDDCYVYADYKAAFCNNGICKCSPGFYQREYRTCRPEGKKIGDACTINNDCTFNSNANCDDFKCAVSGDKRVPESYSTNDLFESDAVEKDTSSVVNCKTDKDCTILNNALCGPSGTCICKRAYFREGNGTCVPELGEACQGTDDNNDIENSECRNGIWTCKAGYIISLDNQKCVKARRKYGYDCSVDMHCSIFGPDAICIDVVNGKGCACNEKSRFNETELFCWTKRGLEEQCQQDIDCYVDGATSTFSCINNTCSCPNGSHPNSNRTECVENAADLGMPCEAVTDCATENAVCVNDICVCRDSYYESEGRCDQGINSNCTSISECKPENSQCNEGHCICNEAYVAASFGLCVPVVSFGDPCERDVQCAAAVSDAICINADNSTTNKTCACIEGYHNRFDKCNKRKVLGTSCENHGECYLDSNESQVVCKNGKCACDWNYVRVNDTVCRIRSTIQPSVNSGTTRIISGLLPVLLLLTNYLNAIKR